MSFRGSAMPEAHSLAWSQIPCVDAPNFQVLAAQDRRVAYEELGAVVEPSPDLALNHLDYVCKQMAEIFESPVESERK